VGADVVERIYPREDAYSYRMSVPREVLDPALLAGARGRGDVTVLRPARVRDVTVAASGSCAADRPDRPGRSAAGRAAAV
jgi:2-polyprenyl-6-methoxyphenol hydroxylase-like FAD-dependent oxidoreductase